jgi:hypothetical protein
LGLGLGSAAASLARSRSGVLPAVLSRSILPRERANVRRQSVSLFSRGLIFLLYPYIRERDPPPDECGFDFRSAI